ncbi:MAG: hypothetical protein ACK5W9_03340 [Bdellovibrionales bacterium]
MKFLNVNFQQLLCVALLLLFSYQNLFAGETATIQQMKGKKAILQFTNDIPFSVGQEVYINSAEGAEIGLSKESRNLLERRNSISLTGEFSNLSQDGEKQTELSLSLLYAWNWSQFEFGPQFSLSNTDISDTTRSTTGVGAYVDYNFDENVPGQDRVWGLVGRVVAANSSTKASGSTTKSNATILDAGLQAKFFQLSQVLAIRTELVYQIQKVKDQKDTTGVVFNFGLQTYF